MKREKDFLSQNFFLSTKEGKSRKNRQPKKIMDYIPSTNAERVLWLQNLETVMSADFALYGVTSGQAIAFAALNATAQAAFVTSTDPSTRTPVTVQATQDAIAAAVASARNLNDIAQVFPATSPNLVAAGFPVRSTVRTPQAPVTASVELEFISALPQQINMQARNVATPTSRAKPADTSAVQLAVAIGTVAAVDPSQATFQQNFTRSPLTLTTDIGDRGKVATVFGRYVSRGSIGGQKVYGPWSLPLVVNLP